MRNIPSRRAFLGSTVATSAALGLGDLGFLSTLAPVSAAEAQVDPNFVQLRPEITPIVRLIEETPREKLLEVIAERLRTGLSYRELLAGLLLAGVKNVEPRPSVGHKFHTVLVVNSAHLASISSPPEHRWLPIFWALDYYKSAAQRDVVERGDWTMQRVDESALPAPSEAARAFTEAMDKWDVSAADTAVAALARQTGAMQVYELLFRYGMRDFRSIGHKAIYVANSWRTLQCIGWQHAEPVLRSLTYALLQHEGDNPSQRDAEADRPYRQNVELAKQVRSDWQAGIVEPSATRELLATLRSATPQQASEQVVDLLNRKISPQAVWDALFVAAGELLMRQPAIVALHAVTTTNALHFAYQTSGDQETRLLLMLQNAAFLAMFRDAMGGRGSVKSLSIDDLQPEVPTEQGAGAIEEIFSELNGQPATAASKMLGYLNQSQDASEMMDAARVLIFMKGDNAHDYKFSSAVLEDYYHLSPDWRNTYMASNLFLMRGSQTPDNQLVARARSALKG
ncbi:hypothetical protein [Aeoliella mucimassa]|uniref:Twin-arginine translocation signal domain-containing protein n=1 Tax=Aeoliella mucimassa TaxID=2527972 RepID=A0A518AQI4_9BACT|nr:hypothetical protein [Aeoliella mucimassa]QDU56976.1 hypothetical protein Pan181_31880 [Aeoliella mucimassa]